MIFARSKQPRLSIYVLSILIVNLAVGCENKRESKVSLPAENAAPPPVASLSKPTNTDASALATGPAQNEALQDQTSVTQAATTTTEVAPIQAGPGTGAGARLTGEVSAPRRSVLAFKQQGFIATIQSKAGSVVKKGDVLATLDTQDFTLRLEFARARKEQAKIAAATAEKELKREQQLAKDNASTEMALDRVQAQFDQAKLALKLAELDVVSAQRALDEARLVAPYDCSVVDQIKDEAEWVRPGDGVFTVFDTQPPEIKLVAPERLMGKIAVGDQLKFFIPSAGFEGIAEVVRVVSVVNERTRTFQVYARPKDSDSRLVPGSYAEALLD